MEILLSLFLRCRYCAQGISYNFPKVIWAVMAELGFGLHQICAIDPKIHDLAEHRALP